jgi:hypothetical protein
MESALHSVERGVGADLAARVHPQG